VVLVVNCAQKQLMSVSVQCGSDDSWLLTYYHIYQDHIMELTNANITILVTIIDGKHHHSKI
jgi:hypothetical protein